MEVDRSPDLGEVRLAEPVWRQAAAAHAAIVDELTAGRLERRARGLKHPVHDFLFEYYGFRPGQLKRWHPGPGVVLEGALERADWSGYVVEDGCARVDLAGFVARRGAAAARARDLLRATASRPAFHGCFGLHEWAMVYRIGQGEVRHTAWPLRLGADGTDAVVEQATIRCSHFDAYRFFTPAARALNTVVPTRDSQLAMEQPGCLHAAMDLYKWCFTLCPGIPSELTLRCFQLALAARELDMRAAPYDLRELGYQPIPIETPDGRAEYVRRQRELATRTAPLRAEVAEAAARLATPDAG